MENYSRGMCPREESNLNYKIRNLASYPLNDEGSSRVAASALRPAMGPRRAGTTVR